MGMEPSQQAREYPLIRGIKSPRDVQRMSPAQARALADEVRGFLIEKVSRTGGHLGPNLGVVELTIALHRAFTSPNDVLLWDTGHQSYVHKILTGRAAGFDQLRQAGGLSGYPSRAESPHDVIENSHASTALSYADGIAKAFRLSGQSGRHVIPIVGDGALTGGMSWEALNNIAASDDLPIVIVVNDNERSYSPTVGGVAHHLATLRTTKGYESFLKWGKDVLQRTPVFGRPMFEALHGMKKGLKDMVSPQGMFEDLGLKYIGPIDGHNIEEATKALALARGYGSPVIVHFITEKGRGHAPAINDDAERFHAVKVIHPVTGEPLTAEAPTWTNAFSNEMVSIGRRRDDVVAITAAMLGPTGLDAFASQFPDRIFDVGIAEQHAVASAAGLAYAGMHPVFAVYSTFLNRAIDQVVLDCAMHKAGVTFVLDRAGVTGDDGPSHHGIWDMAMLMPVPEVRIAAPRDAVVLKVLLGEALEVSDAPTVVRFPKGAVPEPIVAVDTVGDCDVLRACAQPMVSIVAIGAMAHLALELAEALAAEGIATRVIDPRWVKPLPQGVVTLTDGVPVVVVLEDGVKVGGVGSVVATELSQMGSTSTVLAAGVPSEFFAHGKRAAVLANAGLSVEQLTQRVRSAVAAKLRN